MPYAEDSIHAAILAYLRRVLPPSWLAFHCPNGGLRDGRVGARLKRLGTLPGVPDILIIGPGGKVAFIEVKTPRGRLSPAQKQFAEFCERNDVPWQMASSIDDARAFLCQLNIPTREAA